MAGRHAERFVREMGCTEVEFLAWLPAAAGAHRFHLGAAQARIAIDDGALHLAWRAAEPRVIALLRIPRLQVSFAFEGVDAPARDAFMERFDLFTRRGGG